MSTPTTSRIPTLDGWRGIAILLVLFDHIQVAFKGDYLAPWMQSGQHGVTIFFVLSGFLITSKLLEGPIDLRRFYIRRFFRLMPAAWAYLACLLLFDALCHQHYVSMPEVASCVFFYRNFRGFDLTVAAGHFWSLSLEEQFYLVWPCILALAGLRRSRRIATAIAFAAVVACAGWRFTHWNYYNRLWFNFQTQVRVDAILIGCLLAFAMSDARARKFIVRYAIWWTAPALVWLTWCLVTYHQLPPLSESLCIAALLCATVCHSESAFFRWLNARPLTALGTISYSIYIWQQFFLLDRNPTVTLVMLCAMPFFALASYHWLERPAMRFGNRLTSTSRATEPTADLALATT
jgi:peptidoglycan/LPS O-acetylase OafA/YrhL